MGDEQLLSHTKEFFEKSVAIIFAPSKFDVFPSNPLQGHTVDVENLQRAFEDAGFYKVIVLSENHTKPTKENLEKIMDELSPQLRLWFHIATHGLSLPDGEVVLTACDSKLGKNGYLSSSFITAKEVDRWIAHHDFTIVSILYNYQYIKRYRIYRYLIRLLSVDPRSLLLLGIKGWRGRDHI